MNIEKDNEKSVPVTELKKGKNAEKCRRYREQKKAEALKSPLTHELLKRKNAEKSRKHRKKQKIERMTNNSQILSVSRLEPMFVQQNELSFVQIQPSAASTRHIKLRQENTANFKEAIINGAELTAEHINNFQDIVANWFLNFRPIDVHLITLPQYVRPISNLQKHIQIMTGDKTHWICTYYDGYVINVYDSLNIDTLRAEMEVFLNHLFPHKPPRKFHRVREQKNDSDSGVYAVAFTTSLLNNRDPVKENYDHPKMRSHLLDIYNTTELLPFPIEPTADALRKRKANNVSFQHKEHTAAALHMRKVRAQKKMERLQEETRRHQCICCMKSSPEDQLQSMWGDEGDEYSTRLQYGDVLVDCFALDWRPPRYPAKSPSHRICSHCIERLLVAARFKAELASRSVQIKQERATDDDDESDDDKNKTDDDKNSGDLIDVELEPITEVTVKMEPFEATDEFSTLTETERVLRTANSEKIIPTPQTRQDVTVKVEALEANDENLTSNGTKRLLQSSNPIAKSPNISIEEPNALINHKRIY